MHVAGFFFAQASLAKIFFWELSPHLRLHLRLQKRSICNIQISIDNQNIVKVKETNFLGVILDENLKLEVGNISRCK